MLDPFQKYDEDQFSTRFRFSKDATYHLFIIIKDDKSLEVREHSVPPMVQLLTTLRFFATGHFQKSDGDLIGIHRTTAGKAIHRVSKTIAERKPQFIQFPDTLQLPRVKEDFYNVCGFPSVVGAIDCTHIPIISPGGDSGEVFRNRKGYFSINVQAICNANICERYHRLYRLTYKPYEVRNVRYRRLPYVDGCQKS